MKLQARNNSWGRYGRRRYNQTLRNACYMYNSYKISVVYPTPNNTVNPMEVRAIGRVYPPPEIVPFCEIFCEGYFWGTLKASLFRSEKCAFHEVKQWILCLIVRSRYLIYQKEITALQFKHVVKAKLYFNDESITKSIRMLS